MMSKVLSSRLFRGAVLPVILAVAAFPALAQDAQEINNEINRATQQIIQNDRELFKTFTDTVSQGITKVGQAVKSAEAEEYNLGFHSNPIPQLERIFTATPMANAMVDEISREVMLNRYRESNRVKPKAGGRADYLLDTSSDDRINAMAQDIFMRYFCDPSSRGGSMAKTTFNKKDVNIGGKTYNYQLGCGYTSDSSVPTRHTSLGASGSSADREKIDQSAEAQQIIGLPTRPDVLFFQPATFPSKAPAGKEPTGADGTNVNRLAHIYYAAFSQSLLFLLGEPPAPPSSMSTTGGASSYVNVQGQVVKQMLASYPFAILFSERMGTMGPDAAQALASLLTTKLGAATEDPTMYAILQNIKNRNNISVAEYMDIVMYQLPQSSGYYARINEELNATELQREAVWLTAMQTALNYQRNRWLEILATLEAIR